MSAYSKHTLEGANTLASLGQSLSLLEEETPREVVGVGCFTTGLPADAVNVAYYKTNIDADRLPGLRLEKVPASAQSSDQEFFSYMGQFVDAYTLLDHAVVCISGAYVHVILLREKPAGIGPAILVGDGTWGWHAEVVGNDIVVKGAKTTAFGGESDASDSGETASGFPTRGHPNLLGCAVPFAYTGDVQSSIDALGGSPIPKMPYGIFSNGEINPNGAHVVVSDPATNRTIQVPVIDRGPAKNSADPRPLDLTVAAARYFDPAATANSFSKILDYRILNGALLGGVVRVSGAADGFPSRLAGVAMREFNSYSEIDEDDQPLSGRIRQYWEGIGFDFSSTEAAWSAVFVSWCVKQAGATEDEFRFAVAHSTFVYWAIKQPGLPKPAFSGHAPSGYAPRVGDIIQNNRGNRSYDFDYAARHWQYESHSAIVVEVGSDSDGRYALTIGGNESDSIRRSKVRLDSSGRIKHRARDPYIAVLRNIKTS